MHRKPDQMKSKLAIASCLLCWAIPAASQTTVARVEIHADRPGPIIDPNIYGQFVEHLGRGVYEGIWVGDDSKIPNVRGIRSDVVAALRKIHVPVVRWPGGCFAEVYNWRDGVGPRERRPRSVNTAWGDEAESNAFGTHEFMDFVEQIGAKAFLSVNVTTASPGDARQWLQYMTAPADSTLGHERAANGHREPYAVPFVGIGNETWGCGGNMTAEHYADVYRQYLAALGTASWQLVASDANSDDYDWTQTLLDKALYRHASSTPLAYISKRQQISMLSVHFYTFSGNDWGQKSPAIGFTGKDWAMSMERTWKTDELLARHSALIDRYDAQKQIGLAFSEWGTWWSADPKRPSNLYQQNTLRDAVIAGLTLNIFQNHADRVRMANIAQLANVLQSMVLTRGEKMILTPTYHVFDLYQVHQGATLLPADIRSPNYQYETIEVPSVSVSASRATDGVVNLSLVNLDPDHPVRVEVLTKGMILRTAVGQVLTDKLADGHPDFDVPHAVEPASLKGIDVRRGTMSLELPAKSVAVLKLTE